MTGKTDKKYNYEQFKEDINTLYYQAIPTTRLVTGRIHPMLDPKERNRDIFNQLCDVFENLSPNYIYNQNKRFDYTETPVTDIPLTEKGCEFRNQYEKIDYDLINYETSENTHRKVLNINSRLDEINKGGTRMFPSKNAQHNSGMKEFGDMMKEQRTKIIDLKTSLTEFLQEGSITAPGKIEMLEKLSKKLDSVLTGSGPLSKSSLKFYDRYSNAEISK